MPCRLFKISPLAYISFIALNKSKPTCLATYGIFDAARLIPRFFQGHVLRKNGICVVRNP
jgi:hypothetical protein